MTALVLAACTGTSPDPSGSASATPSPEASSSTAPAPTAPVLVPDGTAEDNLPFFATIVQAVWESPGQVQGRAYIDALTAAGFDKSAMQVTADQSTVGNPAESIQFSVRWGSECLIGQVGPATGLPLATTADALEGDFCLIGQTRPIDW